MLYGKTFRTDAEEIDLSNCPVNDDGSALKDALNQFPYLRKADLSGCGMSNEALDELNRRCGDIRIVWTVKVGSYAIRTDDTGFITANRKGTGLNNETVQNMRYCTDMVALDLGHSSIYDLSFLSDMKHLRFLIAADCPVSDISVLGGLPELEYLELFLTYITDLSPLLACHNLKDLNICYIPGGHGQEHMAVLSQMTWLERLWYCGNPWTTQERNELAARFPETSEIILYNGLESTGLDWRYHERYYEMRDILDMYYMEAVVEKKK